MKNNQIEPILEFNESLWIKLKTVLHQTANESKTSKIAAFDADGTLWDADAGETFFDWQIENCRPQLPLLPVDPWAQYLNLKKQDPRIAYVWLAQINAGMPLTQVQTWAKTCFNEFPQWPIFQSQVQLIDLLKSLNFEIYIVTASIKWAVEPLAMKLGIPEANVLGVTTQVIDGHVSNEPVYPITWRDGKAESLLKATGGVRPLLACGNTLGDLALLETATHLPFAVSTQTQPGSKLYEEEVKLTQEAEKRNWLYHPFH